MSNEVFTEVFAEIFLQIINSMSVRKKFLERRCSKDFITL